MLKRPYKTIKYSVSHPLDEEEKASSNDMLLLKVEPNITRSGIAMHVVGEIFYTENSQDVFICTT